MEKLLVIESHGLKAADSELLGRDHRLLVHVGSTAGYMPDGFFVTQEAMRLHLAQGRLGLQLEALSKLWIRRELSRAELEDKIESLLGQHAMPESLVHMVHALYMELGRHTPMILRISGEAAMEGHKIVGPVEGETNVMMAIMSLWVWYIHSWISRQTKKPAQISLASISVLALLDADYSGLVVSHGSKSHHMIIEAVAGSSEFDIHESVTPDRWELIKDSWHLHTFSKGVQKKKSLWREQQIHHEEHTHSEQPHLNSKQLEEIATLARKIENEVKHHVEIDWVMRKNKIWVVHIRAFEPDHPQSSLKRIAPLAHGEGVYPGIACGYLVDGRKSMPDSIAGAIVLLESLHAGTLMRLRHAQGAIIETIDFEGKRLAKELGIPMVADLRIKKFSRRVVTIDGRSGQVYQGNVLQSSHKIIEPLLPLHLETDVHASSQSKIATPIWRMGRTPADNTQGQMLSLNDEIRTLGVHPAFLESGGQSQNLVDQIDRSLAVIAHSLAPRPLMVRLSDLAADDFAKLRYGGGYETTTFGLVGASRHEAHPELLAMEVAGLIRARHKHAQMNIWTLIPHVRSRIQALSLKRELATLGLVRSASCKVWISISSAGAWWEISDILDVGFDGVVIDWDEFLRSFWGMSPKLSDEVVFPETVLHGFIDFLENRMAYLQKAQVSVLMKFHSILPASLISRFLAIGIRGFVVTAENDAELRTILEKVEKR